MLYDALAASGLFFWLALFAGFLLVSWPLGKDKPAAGVIVAAVVVIAFVLLTDVVYRVGIWTLLFVLPLYILIGVGWALFKWRGYVLAQKAEIKTILANRQPSQWPGMTDQAVMEKHRPTAADNKERITGWMALWPWSMSWVVLRFPWRAIVWTYERISTVFERWSAKLWQE